MIRMNNRDITGVLVVDKSKGPTSHDIIASLRRILQMRRIGHCGTLDPLASGVLVVCLGNYTRLNRWLSHADKEYNATLCLGATSVTGDAQGPIAESSGYTIPDASIVAEIIQWGHQELIAQGLGSYITIATNQGNFAQIALGVIIMCLWVTIINIIFCS